MQKLFNIRILIATHRQHCITYFCSAVDMSYIRLFFYKSACFGNFTRAYAVKAHPTILVRLLVIRTIFYLLSGKNHKRVICNKRVSFSVYAILSLTLYYVMHKVKITLTAPTMIRPTLFVPRLIQKQYVVVTSVWCKHVVIAHDKIILSPLQFFNMQMLHGMSQALHVYIIAQNIALGNSLTIQRIYGRI